MATPVLLFFSLDDDDYLCIELSLGGIWARRQKNSKRLWEKRRTGCIVCWLPTKTWTIIETMVGLFLPFPQTS